METACGSLLDGFARGIERDRKAVAVAIATPWSTSPGEGQITRLKAIKRSMYGRAGFHLLRQRVLIAASAPRGRGHATCRPTSAR
jgi:transposase